MNFFICSFRLFRNRWPWVTGYVVDMSKDGRMESWFGTNVFARCVAYKSKPRVNKTAELSQRRPRDAPNIWVPWKVLRVLNSHPATFSEICSRLLFRSILRMCVQKLKFVALPVPQIIGGTQKNLGSPCIRPRSLFSQIFKGLLFAWTLWIYLPSLQSVALPVPEIIGGTQKKIWVVPVYAHAPFSPKFLIGFCSHGPSEYICQIWRS